MQENLCILNRITSIFRTVRRRVAWYKIIIQTFGVVYTME